MRAVPHLPEVLAGLHPVSSHPCARCGAPTTALANGRGRLDICQPCGSLTLVGHDGLEILSLRDAMRDLSLPIARRARL